MVSNGILCCTHESYPGSYRLRHNHATINGGIPSVTAAEWAASPTARPWSRFDLSTCVPDYAGILLDANDLRNSLAGATVQASLTTEIATVKAPGIKRIFMGTILPTNRTGTPETDRLALNAWIRTRPYGIDGVWDLDKALRNPATPAVCEADTIHTDNLHPLIAGRERMASAIHVRG